MYGAMQQAFFIWNGRLLAWIYYIFCLALANAALIGVVMQGGFSSLYIPDMTVTVGILPRYLLEGVCP